MIYFIGIVYLLWVLLTIYKIISHVQNPSKAISWIFAVVFLPLIGILFYKLLGRNIKKEKKFLQKKPFYFSEYPVDIPRLLPRQKRLLKLLSKNQSSAFSQGNQVSILKNGMDTFKDIFNEIRLAQYFIHLDYYIIEEGEILNKLIEILLERKKNGVEVRIIYDGFGTYPLSDNIKSELNKAGIEIQEFMPFHFFRSFKFMNYRNHRKMVIIDNRIAYTGGMNISDKYVNGDPKLGPWIDIFIKITGPAALDFEKIFECDWFYADGDKYVIPPMHHAMMDGHLVQVISSGPDSNYPSILQEYFTLITDAEEYIYITTPYFVPGESIMTALCTSVLSGVDVRIILPFDSDSKWLKWCMLTYLEKLLVAGVKIYFYHAGFLHCKVIITDDIISSVGTANVDERSFQSNFEINAIVYNQETTLQLKKNFFQYLEHCEELTIANFPLRKDRNIVLEKLARLSSPLF